MCSNLARATGVCFEFAVAVGFAAVVKERLHQILEEGWVGWDNAGGGKHTAITNSHSNSDVFKGFN